MKARELLVMGFAAAVISGCSGGGSTGSVAQTGTQTQTQTVSGVVADGYIQGAIVFLDKNGNKLKDEGEPFATTKTGGKYDMENVTATDIATYPIVVDVPVTAVDEDRGPITKAYVLSAPAGKPEFVSPITTLIQNQVEANPTLTVAEAEKTVKTNLGVSDSVNLFANFIEKKADTSNSAAAAEYAKIHNVAQVVATAVGNNMDAIRTAAPDAKLNDIIKVIVEQVVTQLTQITAAVEEAKATNTTFNPTSVATSTMPATTFTADTKTLTQSLQQASAAPTASSFKDMAADGFYSVGREYDGQGGYIYGYQRIRLGAQGTSGYAMTEEYFKHANGDWSAFTPTWLANEESYFLTANGWIAASDNASAGTVTFNADNSATWTITKTGHSEKVQVTKIDVAGKPIAPFVEREGITVKSGAVFSPGAVAYKMSFSSAEDRYSIWGGNTSDTRFSGATSVDALLKLYASTEQQGLYVGKNLSFKFAGATSGTSGAVEFYEYVNQGYVKLTQTGSWEKKSVGNQTLLIVVVPTTLRILKYELTWLEPGEDIMFGVINGQVRQGQARYANIVKIDRSPNFNKIALDDIKANFVAGGTVSATTQAAKRTSKPIRR